MRTTNLDTKLTPAKAARAWARQNPDRTTQMQMFSTTHRPRSRHQLTTRWNYFWTKAGNAYQESRTKGAIGVCCLSGRIIVEYGELIDALVPNPHAGEPEPRFGKSTQDAYAKVLGASREALAQIEGAIPANEDKFWEVQKYVEPGKVQPILQNVAPELVPQYSSDSAKPCWVWQKLIFAR
ncbi:hypothetical protein [Acaryochloris sp. CCMEE 5410]|uniref:hypothetical protein n=1 Tax=Acaryochloris sp. CCMEE 5410 TaxID=310037 RepID=UPI0002484706|nr:hypothetical protein [Acaryochloris sp. CCMEE 5410]KAI9129964.1 hypothetical protein ON05_030355 [Acaryochloris sp. CCMEE 5410]